MDVFWKQQAYAKIVKQMLVYTGPSIPVLYQFLYNDNYCLKSGKHIF